MAQRKRRGFTIVELVIVIAVIAILAGVLIPTFISVINKANVASDTSLVKNINEALVAEEVTEGKPATMYEALQRAEANGFTIEKLTPRSTGDIVWNSESNRFALVDKTGKVVYSANGEAVPHNETVWKIAHEAKGLDTLYSNYLAYPVTDAIVVTAGVDVGENKGVTKVTYNGTSQARSIVIRTMGSTEIEINGYVDSSDNTKGDVVAHYGEAGSVDVVKCAMASYHEYGDVGFIKVTNGRLAVESTASVVTVYASAATAKIDNNSGSIENAYAADGVTNSGNVALSEIPADSSVEQIKKNAQDKHGAVALVDGKYQTSLEAAFTTALALQTATIDIIKDFDMTDISWKPIDIGYHDGGAVNTICKSLTLNGNNHTITGFNVHYTSTNHPSGEVGAGQSNYYGEGLFGRISEDVTLEISNLTFDNAFVDDTSRTVVGTTATTSQVAVLIGRNSGSVVLNNVNVVNSYLYGGQKVGVFVGHNNGTLSVIGGSIVNTEIKCYCAQSAQVVGFYGAGTLSISNLKLKGNSISMYYVNDALSTPYTKHKKDANGNTYVDFGSDESIWFVGTSTVVGGTSQKNVTLADGTVIISYGYDYPYTQNGDLYSVNSSK